MLSCDAVRTGSSCWERRTLSCSLAAPHVCCPVGCCRRRCCCCFTGYTQDRFYIHCDGALFGMMMPFIKEVRAGSSSSKQRTPGYTGHAWHQKLCARDCLLSPPTCPAGHMPTAALTTHERVLSQVKHLTLCSTLVLPCRPPCLLPYTHRRPW